MSAPTDPRSHATDRDEPASGPRIVVTAGGEPSPEEIAALSIALTPAESVWTDVSVPAWRRAALSEGVGGRRVLAPADLQAAVHDRWG